MPPAHAQPMMLEIETPDISNMLVGRNPIREALKAGKPVEKLVVSAGDLSGAAMDIIRMAREAGVELYPGELLAVGEEYSDNQCKSTNGGNPTPYDSFNDAYEIFLASVGI